MLPDWIKRFAFPLVMLAVAVFIATGWMGQWSFLGSFIGWAAVQAFLEKNNEGFFVAALIAFYMEAMRPNTFSDFFKARLTTLDGFLAAVGPADGVRFFLERRHGAAGAAALTEYVASAKPAIRNCDVRISLWRSASRHAGGPHQLFELNYDCEVRDVVLACARTAGVQSLLMALFPEILEAVVLDGEADFAAGCARLLAAQPIRVDDRPLAFKPFPLEQDGRHDALQSLERGTDYELYLARVEPFQPGRANNFLVTLHIPMARSSAGTAHWMADRPMQVRSIVIDATDLRHHAGTEFKLIPFLGGHEGVRDDDPSAARYALAVNRWLVQGQGVALAWHGLPTTAAAAGAAVTASG